MTYNVIIKRSAQKEMAALPVFEQERIDDAILRLCDGLAGDVKKLKNFYPRYRLRVGQYRVLFEVEDRAVVIHSIKIRKDVYR